MKVDRRGVFRLKPRSGHPVGDAAMRLLRSPAERLLGLDALGRVYREIPRCSSTADFCAAALDCLGVRIEIDEAGLAGVPASGPVVVVANHPFGGVEGLILGQLLLTRRPDSRILANYMLQRIPELRDLFLPLDPFGGPRSARANIAGLRGAMRWLDRGGLLATFPSGEVSHLDLKRGRVEDPPWLDTVEGLVRRARCPVVPVFFPGRNGALFQSLGLLHPRFRTLLLVRELLRRRGATIEVRVGSPMLPRQLAAFDGKGSLTRYLRSRTYILGEREPMSAPAVQPRVTPASTSPIVEAPPPGVLADEVARLAPDRLLVDAGNEAVYVARGAEIPQLLLEIGRQREISFRAVGEGTGREIDLDPFDRTYRHLFLWDRRERQLVGAYRIGLTDELLADRRLDALYTSTLFDFKRSLFEAMGPALEMGRSFIRPEHQKSYAGLLLLWKGIGQFVVRHPRYATLFGPVSISADYRSASQRLIVSFLERNRYAHEWSEWVRPRSPVKGGRSGRSPLSPAELRDLDDVSTFISEIEADHKGVPVLLKQYLKLGGRLLGFNVDPEFSNVLDVLIMVDLRCTAPRILARYMGRDGAASFLGAHRTDSHSRAS